MQYLESVVVLRSSVCPRSFCSAESNSHCTAKPRYLKTRDGILSRQCLSCPDHIRDRHHQAATGRTGATCDETRAHCFHVATTGSGRTGSRFARRIRNGSFFRSHHAHACRSHCRGDAYCRRQANRLSCRHRWWFDHWTFESNCVQDRSAADRYSDDLRRLGDDADTRPDRGRR